MSKLEVTDAYLKAKREGKPLPPRIVLAPNEMRRLRTERDATVGWAVSPADEVAEIRPDGVREGDPCPICPGVIGGGHMPGCVIGGRASKRKY